MFCPGTPLFVSGVAMLISFRDPGARLLFLLTGFSSIWKPGVLGTKGSSDQAMITGLLVYRVLEAPSMGDCRK